MFLSQEFVHNSFRCMHLCIKPLQTLYRLISALTTCKRATSHKRPPRLDNLGGRFREGSTVEHNNVNSKCKEFNFLGVCIMGWVGPWAVLSFFFFF